MISSFVGAKLAIAAVAGSLSIGGVAAAAVTGTLPGPFAHSASSTASDTVSAEPSESAEPSQSPDPTQSADPSESPDPSTSAAPRTDPTHRGIGPDATGPAAFGLCHAFGGDKADRKSDNPSVAYRNLLAAATAAGQTVQAYCASILGVPVPTTTTDSPGTNDPARHDHAHDNWSGHGGQGSHSGHGGHGGGGHR